jgi:transporter family-2 protein
VPEPLRLTWRRLLAGLTAVMGLAVAVLSGSSGLSADLGTVIGIGMLLFVGGIAIGGQQAGNGKVTSIAGDPVVAGLTSAAGGTAGISLLLGVVAASGTLGDVALPDLLDHWYLYLGGPLGAAITVGAAWAVRHLGTFALTLAVVGGQMVTALVIDLFTSAGLHWSTVVAAAMIAGATVMVVGRRRPA